MQGITFKDIYFATNQLIYRIKVNWVAVHVQMYLSWLNFDECLYAVLYDKTMIRDIWCSIGFMYHNLEQTHCQVCHFKISYGTLFIHILTSNENATPKCTSISQGYIEYTFTEDVWGFNEYERQTPYWLY